MNIFNNGISIGICMALIDVISMGTSKYVNLGILSNNWLGFAIILYGFQMVLFNIGLKTTQMTVLNLSWNLFSNIIITIIGIYYFKENINQLETYGILFAIFALFLFGLGEYNK